MPVPQTHGLTPSPGSHRPQAHTVLQTYQLTLSPRCTGSCCPLGCTASCCPQAHAVPQMHHLTLSPSYTGSHCPQAHTALQTHWLTLSCRCMGSHCPSDSLVHTVLQKQLVCPWFQSADGSLTKSSQESADATAHWLSYCSLTTMSECQCQEQSCHMAVAIEMTQPVKTLATKPDNLGSISRSHMVRKQLLQIAL